VTNDELALRSSIGLFLFVPPGVNEQLIEASGFVAKPEDVSANAALVWGVWHDRGNRHKEAVDERSKEEPFEVSTIFCAVKALPVKEAIENRIPVEKQAR